MVQFMQGLATIYDLPTPHCGAVIKVPQTIIEANFPSIYKRFLTETRPTQLCETQIFRLWVENLFWWEFNVEIFCEKVSVENVWWKILVKNLEPSAFQKYSIHWVLEALCICSLSFCKSSSWSLWQAFRKYMVCMVWTIIQWR